MNLQDVLGAVKGKIKAVPLLVGALTLIMTSGIASIFYVTSQTGRDQQYLQLGADLQLVAQQIATYALEAASGKEPAFVQLRNQRDRFDTMLNTLVRGDEQAGIQPVYPELLHTVGIVGSRWERYRKNIDTILDHRESVLSVRAQAKWIADTAPALAVTAEQILVDGSKQDLPSALIFAVARQGMLAERIRNHTFEVLSGGSGTALAADQMAKDLRDFKAALQSAHKIELATRKDGQTRDGLRAGLKKIDASFAALVHRARRLLKSVPDILSVNDAAGQVESLGAQIVEDAKGVESAVASHDRQLDLFTRGAIGLGVLSVILLIVTGHLLIRGAKQREQIATEASNRNERAILRLLDEMATLAEGDLTINATVTEDMTGAIADAINFAIEALRHLVSTINDTAENISTSTEVTKDTAQHLADASNYQAQEIASASAAISDMAASIQKVSSHALSSAEVANQSVEIAHKGAQTVSRTIDGMGVIREQIQETSKRIKRLGESSQEIGDIVSLIDDIADQTNILALNAAIQASTAGEAGRGFAVVADEVQRLAERASHATKQIEGLVKTIQADTNEAVISMEQSTSNVVAGAHLAEDAGDALGEIETVSTKLASLIQFISQAAKQQSSAAGNVANTMNVIQEITLQTSDSIQDTVRSVDQLDELSNKLHESVAGFKLPVGKNSDTASVIEHKVRLAS